MSTIIYPGFYTDLMAGVVDSADIRTILVMTNTTCDTEDTADTFADFTTVDEMDGVGYAELDHTISASAYDATDERWEITVAADEDFSGGLGIVNAGSRDVQGAVVKRYVDGSTGDIPWFYTDDWTNLPLAASGGDVAFTPAASAFLLIRVAD